MISYEDKINRIEEIINSLENKDISLEDNVKLVEEGSILTKKCREYLDSTDLKIKKIIDDKEEEFD